MDQGIVPSEVADFRVLHANHAISTAGHPLRGIISGVHLDGRETKIGRYDEKVKFTKRRKSSQTRAIAS